MQPAPFTTAHAVQERIHSPSEFSQLPDFSYSLWDWALGNETCPLDHSIAPDDCHKFAGHMGATNSNHFLPQTSTAYNWYHQLAMNRAAACDVLRTRIGSRSDLQRFVKECVSEALVLEAAAIVGQDFLRGL